MFLAWRDIRFAKGRFALMGAVVALITLLIVLLSGLTAGLAHQSTAAIASLNADRIVFGSQHGDVEASYSDSVITEEQLDTWDSADGITNAAPLGIASGRLETNNGAGAAISLFGARDHDDLAPETITDDGIIIPTDLAEELSLASGDTITMSGHEFTVTDIAGNDAFSHTPVAWADLSAFHDIMAPRHDGNPPIATVLATNVTDNADVDAIDSAADTTSETRTDSFAAIGSFSAENGSLQTMQILLYAISALVVGAFITVWTIQRSGDIAVLKALGGSTRYLLRDALSQALLVLLVGTALGGGVASAAGVVAASFVPFELTIATTLFPVAALIALGMVGSVLAVRRITSVDPLTALGGVR